MTTNPLVLFPAMPLTAARDIDTDFADALRILFDNKVSGIALVDHEGRLSGYLSASDLRVRISIVISCFFLILSFRY